jgi:hypothetical protein
LLGDFSVSRNRCLRCGASMGASSRCLQPRPTRRCKPRPRVQRPFAVSTGAGTTLPTASGAGRAWRGRSSSYAAASWAVRGRAEPGAAGASTCAPFKDDPTTTMQVRRSSAPLHRLIVL